jgi:uncharacterized protein (DUF983 family)
MLESELPQEVTMSETQYAFSQRLQILLRCLGRSCPRCSQPAISGIFHFKSQCPGCGLVLDRKNGFLLAALPYSYFIYAVFWLVPILVLWAQKSLSYPQAFGLVAVGAVVLPVLLYNYCKMIALGQYYFFLPRELGLELGLEPGLEQG